MFVPSVHLCATTSELTYAGTNIRVFHVSFFGAGNISTRGITSIYLTNNPKCTMCVFFFSKGKVERTPWHVCVCVCARVCVCLCPTVSYMICFKCLSIQQRCFLSVRRGPSALGTQLLVAGHGAHLDQATVQTAHLLVISLEFQNRESIWNNTVKLILVFISMSWLPRGNDKKCKECR